MKKYAAFIVLALAIGSGVAAVYLANRWMSSQGAEQPMVVKETVPLTDVVIAAVNVEVGARLTEENLAITQWPKSTVPRGSFTSVEELKDRVAVTRLTAGQPVIAAELAAPGSGAGLVAAITPGYRAMAIRVDEVAGVGGFVLPDTFVDIIVVTNIRSQENAKAKTILERIKVLAIAQQTYTEEGKPMLVKTVTLELKPEEAEKLALKSHLGALHLTLRNPTDELAPEPEPVLVAEKPRSTPQKWVPVIEPRVRVTQQKPFEVEIIRASRPVEKVEFANATSDQRIED